MSHPIGGLVLLCNAVLYLFMTARMQQFNMRLRTVCCTSPACAQSHAIAGREIEQQHRAASEKPRKAEQSVVPSMPRTKSMIGACDGAAAAPQAC